MIQEALKTFLGWVFLLPGFYLAGSVMARFFSETDSRLRGIFFVAGGWILLILWLIGAGCIGQLNVGAVLLFLGITFFVRRSLLPEFARWLREMARYPWLGGSLIDRALSVLFYVTVFFTAVFCFLPETANDALCYQLNVPKQFLWQGSLMPLAYDANSYMPMAMNLLYAVGLMIQSIGAAKIFHVLSGLFLTYTIALKIESFTGHARAARFSALMFWLAPVVVNEVTTTYLDVGVSFFLLIAFLWLQAGVQSERKTTFFLAGLAAGVTVAVKFSLLIAMPILCVTGVLPWLWPLRLKKLFGFGIIFMAGFTAGCGFWFGRNFILTGNPFFPYLGEVFGTIGFTNYATYMDIGIPKTVLNFIALPLHLVFNPEPFDRHYWVGPYFLISFAAMCLCVRDRQTRPYLCFILLLTGAWFLTTHATRYLLPVLPFWYIASGCGLPALASAFKKRGLSVLIKVCAAGFAVVLLAGGAWHHRMQYPVLAGLWTREAYLEKMERSFPAAQWVSRNLPADAKILNIEEIRQFYFERPLIRESILYFFTHYTDTKTPKEIREFLKQEGFTHVMKADGSSRGEPLDRLGSFMKSLESPQGFKKLGSVDSKNIRDSRMSYTFYQIL